jgi:DNA-binding MarR family transcriptional regulator
METLSREKFIQQAAEAVDFMEKRIIDLEDKRHMAEDIALKMYADLITSLKVKQSRMKEQLKKLEQADSEDEWEIAKNDFMYISRIFGEGFSEFSR